MNRHAGGRSVTLSLAALLCAAAFAGCDSGAAGPSGAVSSAPAATATEPATPDTTADPTSTDAPEPTATPDPTSTEQPSPSASASIGPGAVCSGSAENKQYWSQAAAWLTFDVYCPVLPAGWSLISSGFDTKNGGVLAATYSGKGGSRIEIKEGAFCTDGLSACSAHDVVLGTASFGDMPGSLDSLGPGLGYAIYISPGTPPSWQITGTNVGQDTFVAFASGLVRVPQP